jgi:uncharacterized protein (DUF362 family)
MKLHPVLNDPNAVFISRSPVPVSPSWDDFRRVARQALEVLQVVMEGEKVVLKPNVTSGEHFADPELGVDTHPAFVWGLVEYLREHGARRGGIYVLEDPRDTDDNNPRHWKGTGYLEVAEATGAKLRCPTTYTCVKKVVPRPLVHRVRNVSRLAVSPNTVLINVPKLKTHNLGITTLCFKNQMGLDNVFDRHYCGQAMCELQQELKLDRTSARQWMDQALHERWQEGLARRLIDLAQVVQPHLCVVEGVVGRDGTGFHQGRNYPLGMVVAGTNMVAVDSMASYMMGFDPRQIIYLRMAAGHGLGCNDPEQLRIYTAEDGLVLPCLDVESLRANPRFRVIRGIRGEDAMG